MATKKDLIEAQGFSRRRLLTAFTSGAPGGKELEPAKPLRAVAAGIALAAMVMLGGVFYGLVRPGLPSGWENNTLVMVSDTGARYLAINGVLNPVINTASARLLMPTGEFKVITTDRKTIDGIKLGPTIGILGAPDDLPTPDELVNDGWSACTVDEKSTSLAIAKTPAKAVTGAIVVRNDSNYYVVTAEHRFAVPKSETDAVVRAIGLNLNTATEVDDRWLNLFAEGTPFAPLTIPRAGDPLPGGKLSVGMAVHPDGSQDDVRYLITGEGSLAKLSPLAYQLYLLGTGATIGAEKDVLQSDIASLSTATQPAGGSDWPEKSFTESQDAAQHPCALLTHDSDGTAHTLLASLDAETDASSSGARVTTGGGALVRIGAGTVALIDESATVYAIPGANKELLGKLGYTEEDVADVPQAWMQFLAYGPELTVKAAGSSPRPPDGATP